MQMRHVARRNVPSWHSFFMHESRVTCARSHGTVAVNCSVLHFYVSHVAYGQGVMAHVYMYGAMSHSNGMWRVWCSIPYRCSATYCNALQHTATHCTTLQHTATHCSTLQHSAAHCNTVTGRGGFRALFSVSARCNTLPRTVTHCNTLQHAATRCNTLQHSNGMWRVRYSVPVRLSGSYRRAASVCEKEPYIIAKEPYIIAKQPYSCTKQPCTCAKEPYIPAKKPEISANEHCCSQRRLFSSRLSFRVHFLVFIFWRLLDVSLTSCGNTATHCNTLLHTLQCVGVYCSVLCLSYWELSAYLSGA